MLLKKLLENVHEGGGQGFALTKISSSIPGGEDSVANRSMVGAWRLCIHSCDRRGVCNVQCANVIPHDRRDRNCHRGSPAPCTGHSPSWRSFPASNLHRKRNPLL